MKKCLSFLLVATAVAIMIIFSFIMVSMIAWSLVFLTGDLHRSVTQVPALSFWHSYRVISFICLMAFPLQMVIEQLRGR